MKLFIPVASRSKKWDCDLWLSGIVGWISSEVIDICLLWVLWVVKQRYFKWADQWFRWILNGLISSSEGSYRLSEYSWSLKKFSLDSKQQIHVTYRDWKHMAAVGVCISKIIIINILWVNDVKLFVWNLAKYISQIPLCYERVKEMKA